MSQFHLTYAYELFLVSRKEETNLSNASGQSIKGDGKVTYALNRIQDYDIYISNLKFWSECDQRKLDKGKENFQNLILPYQSEDTPSSSNVNFFESPNSGNRTSFVAETQDSHPLSSQPLSPASTPRPLSISPSPRRPKTSLETKILARVRHRLSNGLSVPLEVYSNFFTGLKKGRISLCEWSSKPQEITELAQRLEYCQAHVKPMLWLCKFFWGMIVSIHKPSREAHVAHQGSMPKRMSTLLTAIQFVMATYERMLNNDLNLHGFESAASFLFVLAGR